MSDYQIEIRFPSEGGEVAISQGSNLINVVVHNAADSRGASLGAIILSHALVGGGWGGGVGGVTLAPKHLSLILWLRPHATSSSCILNSDARITGCSGNQRLSLAVVPFSPADNLRPSCGK